MKTGFKHICRLPNRGVLRIGGDDRRSFLQGLVSNDINLCVGDKMLYAALLTPQGKFLHDMFISDAGNSFLIDCEGQRADDLLQRLRAYKLRAKVTFENVSDAFGIWVGWNKVETGTSAREQRIPLPLREGLGVGSFNKTNSGDNVESPHLSSPVKGEGHHRSYVYLDPRLAELGSRLILPKEKTPEGEITDFTTYDKYRLELGIPDGSRDMIVEKSTLLECNLDLLNGINWTKGCYMGQELTARMHYRALVKKRLFPVKIEGAAAECGSVIQVNGDDVGEMRSSCGDIGLALLNIEKADGLLLCGSTKLTAHKPDWLQI